MLSFIKRHPLVWLLPLALFLYHLAFEDTSVFWYMYTFSILVLMSIAIIRYSVFDELKTWQSLIYGLLSGVIIYALLISGYRLLDSMPVNIEGPVSALQAIYAPTSIWQYLLLMFIIVPGEEIFWRGYIQQLLKNYMNAPLAILTAALLFGIALSFSGFWPGIVAGVISAVLLGFLYEWKRSMPVLIIAHLVLLLLLFIILPLPV